MYTLLLWLQLPINVIIVIFGIVVAVLMVVFVRWSKRNMQANPDLHDQIWPGRPWPRVGFDALQDKRAKCLMQQ